MRTTSSDELRPLVVAAVLSIVGICAALGTLWTVERLQTSANEITENAAVSVMYLSRASTEIDELSADLDDVIAGSGGGRALAKIRVRASWQRLSSALNAYFAVPAFPGETDDWDDVTNSVDELRRLMDEVLSEPAGFAAADALAQSRELDQVAARFGHSLSRLTDFNVGQLIRLKSDIQLVRTRLLPAAVGLALLCAIASAGGVLLGLRTVASARDAEAQSRRLLEARAEELEAFAARIAHDLLSPLMTVSLALGRAHVTDERSAAVVARGVSSLQRARRLVEGLFEFARAGAVAPAGAHADVREVADDVRSGFADVAADAGVALTAEISPDLTAACSSGVLTSILSNLIQNAIKFTSAGSSQDRRVTIRARDAGDKIRIEVEDTGPGVPPDRLAMIFEPFVRAAGKTREGLGLGLATVKRLTEAHGGSVGVQSTEGKGSVFWVTLPKPA